MSTLDIAKDTNTRQDLPPEVELLENLKEQKKREREPRNFKVPLSVLATANGVLEEATRTNGIAVPPSPAQFLKNTVAPASTQVRRLNNITNLSLTFSVSWYYNTFFAPGTSPSGSFTVPLYLTILLWNQNAEYEVSVNGSTDDFRNEGLLSISLGNLTYNEPNIQFLLEMQTRTINLLDTIPSRPVIGKSAPTLTLDFTIDPEKITQAQLQKFLDGDLTDIYSTVVVDTSSLSSGDQTWFSTEVTANEVIGINTVLDFYYIGIVASY